MCLYMHMREIKFTRSLVNSCRSLYGFGECVRDTLVEICEDSTGLLDTAMDDVIQGVIGNGLGCEAPTNPILCKHSVFFGYKTGSLFKQFQTSNSVL